MEHTLDTSQLDFILNNYLKRFELTCSCGVDFAYVHSKDHISYALYVHDEAGKLFQKFVSRLEPKLKADVFLLSFFHEIGHHLTWDDLEEEDILASCVAKRNVERMAQIQEYTFEDLNLFYFNIPDELAATQWAINYLMTHTAEITLFWQQASREILKIYHDMEVV